MKKTKKLAALFLALMMAFSLLAVTAAAYGAGDDGIMPLATVRRCTETNCSGTVTLRTVTKYMDWETTCEKCSYRHYHRVPYTVDIEYCDSCPYYKEFPNSDHQFPGVCMHGG